MKYLILAALAFVMVGCTETKTTKKGDAYILPDELADCQVFEMKSQTATDITVVRCPNSTTGTGYTKSRGKSRITLNSVVIDGVKYVQEQPNDVKTEVRSSDRQ